MCKASSPAYWSSWRLFCRQSTCSQLWNIIEKETKAGRYAEAEIAQAVLDEKHSVEDARARGE